jgi:hypothetical protein
MKRFHPHVFIFVIATSLQTSTVYGGDFEDWKIAHDRASSIMFECLQEESFHALEVSATEEQFMKLIGIMCREKLTLEKIGAIGALRAKGYSVEAAENLSRDLQEDILKKSLSVYAEFIRKRNLKTP